MKIRLVALAVNLLLGTSLLANDGLSKYLLFPPQEMTVENGSEAIGTAQLPALEALLTASLEDGSAGKWTLTTEAGEVEIFFGIDAGLQQHDEYELSVREGEVRLNAKDRIALRYGKQTLQQVLAYAKAESQPIPKLQIKDRADFERRGYMLDVSRDKVPTMSSLYALVDQLAAWRINELQLYTEHTFAYRNHPAVWEEASPLTPAEIQALDAYCAKRGIDLVPNQNSFGHMENWLKHEPYRELSECETDCNTIWGKRKRTALAPTDPNSLKLMQELYAELLPNFSSNYANIGGDETVELGLGKSKELCDKIGKGRVYLDFLMKLNEEVNKNGKRTQFWGDIVLNHPELIKDIPKNMTALVWGYDATYPFNKNLVKFKEAGLDFYVCPGTSSWRSVIGRNHNAFLNLKNAAVHGKKFGAKGYLITDWGDQGHFQPKSVSYPSLLLGASYAWNQSDQTLDDLEFKLDHYVFKDPTGNMAKAVLTLGNAYLKTGLPEGNANAFHLMLRRYKWTMDGQYQTKHLTKSGLQLAEQEIEAGIAILREARPQCDDADIIVKELEQAAKLARFAIHLGEARLGAKRKETKAIPRAKKRALAKELAPIIEGHKALWLVRNREGGLKDSAGRLEKLLDHL